MEFDIAWAYRLLEDERKAYRYLSTYLTNRTLLELPLGLGNPILDVFKNDPEFKRILAEINQKFEIARQSIREHDASPPS